ncbi:hypothetical protein Tco_0606406 [Tanacetum coccineum]
MGAHDGNHWDTMEWSENCEKYFLDILSERVKKEPNGAPIFKGIDWIEMDEKIFLKFGLRYGPDRGIRFSNRLGKRVAKLYSLMSLVFSKSTASGSFHNASTYGPQNSEEERRIESEYLGGSEAGDCAESDSKKRKLEGDMENPGMRRMKTSSGKYDAFMDVWTQALVAKTERDLAKAEKYKTDNTSEVKDSVTEEFSIDECMLVSSLCVFS